MTATAEPGAATAADALSPGVRRALANPAPGRERWVAAADRRWFALEWGSAGDPPVLLLHGVTSDADTFWRVGPALAATGRHVLALDLPGHGRTRAWRGRQHFVETAEDVVAFVAAAGIDRPDLAVLGHSWGAMVVSALPAAGARPQALILLDPPALGLAQLEAMVHDPEEQPPADTAAADDMAAALRRAHPEWAEGDVRAKIDGLLRVEPEAARGILLDNGDWDAGVAALGHPAARGIPAWYIRGEWSAGGLIPDSRLPDCVSRVGRDHVITIPGAPHSPQRTHSEATVAAILRALGDDAPSPEHGRPAA